MRYAVFSDVHSNLEAFSVVFDFFKSEKLDRYIFLGDIIGYGANPRECLYLLNQLKPICVAGNHDWAAVDKFSLDYFNEYAKEALLWTKEHLTYEHLVYLNSFSLMYQEDNFLCVHSSLYQPEMFYYILNISDVARNFLLLDKNILFVAHTHRPGCFMLKDDIISYVEKVEFEVSVDAKYIINVGSVGQPRDRDNRACICIYDSDKKTVRFLRFSYDVETAASKILENNLPTFLATRLYIGG